MEYIITHKVDKTLEKSYYSIEFTVPENTESVTVAYSYSRAGNVIDLGLEDCEGKFLGWSGSARSSVTVGEFYSTRGYLRQKINAGQWRILIGAYHVAENGVEVEYKISCTEKHSYVLYGDLHVHSDASDGQFDIPALIKKAKRKGLDFMAVSNHNNYAENFNLPSAENFTLIPAVEWTHYKGHMNFYGVNAPFDSFAVNSGVEMEKLLAQVKGKGALISVNHPRCSLCPYLWESDSYDTAEIWNGPMRADNVNAVSWWTQQLRQNKKLPAVGGSDFHRRIHPVRLGHPVNVVFAKSRSAEDILSAVRNGNCCITSGIKGPRLGMECCGKIMGESVALEGETEIKITAERLFGAKLFYVNQNGEYELKINKNGVASAIISVKEKGFTYLKAVRNILGYKRICAVSNPIYFV